eukprot:CAMPEP_0172470986 /NCGR_PEP_ID=MMETSP1065-20121228/67584_1 /TAXON_ID=265537 /ORGANISM="Amphiprora paludosa, Strain CCMP125" /LENGTH=427 /DNA_ID=CAMNT_0013229069 /DNA_START=69 /DNA_END=1352 /DNA_ORIENTATION=+
MFGGFGRGGGGMTKRSAPTPTDSGSMSSSKKDDTMSEVGSVAAAGRVVDMDPEPSTNNDEMAGLIMESGGAESSPPSRALPDAAPSMSKAKAEAATASKASVISSLGLTVLLICAVQNCAKNLIMRSVMKDQPKFLTSAAVLGSECLKLTLSVGYILLVQRKSLGSIVQYLKDDMRNTLLLIVPASAYNFQTSMEYVALANLNAAMFSVLVQTKLLSTAIFSVSILGKSLKYLQVISLVLLTVGVMLCNMKTGKADDNDMDGSADTTKGILATLGIALSSGFASVYTEKVIKGSGVPRVVNMDEYGLAYTQVQLAGMSILAIGLYALARDWSVILEHGLFYNFTGGAALSCFMSGVGGLVVASVLKYADSILKGYATALSVVMTGILSMFLFGTELSSIYFLGIINVICAVFLYNGRDLDQHMCKSQ